MKKVQVLGAGCAKCSRLKRICEEAVSELGIKAEVSKIEDINQIMDFGVMMTPALAVDGVIKVVGKVPSLEEIKGYLQ